MESNRLRAMLLGGLAAAAALAPGVCGQQEPAAPAPAAQPPAAAAPRDTSGDQARLATLLDGSLVDTRNGDPLMKETAGYRRLLQLVAALDPAEATRRASKPLDRTLALKDPDALRGEYVRVRGLLAGIKAERLDQPLDGAVDIWEGVVSDTDGSDGVVFDIVVKPTDVEPRRDLVDVEGVFYRTARYENQKGELVESPYLVVRNVTRVDTSTLPVTGLGGGVFPMVLIGAAVIFLVVRVLMMIRDRSSKPSSDGASAIRRAAAEHARAARAAKAASQGSQDPPGPPAKPT